MRLIIAVDKPAERARWQPAVSSSSPELGWLSNCVGIPFLSHIPNQLFKCLFVLKPIRKKKGMLRLITDITTLPPDRKSRLWSSSLSLQCMIVCPEILPGLLGCTVRSYKETIKKNIFKKRERNIHNGVYKIHIYLACTSLVLYISNIKYWHIFFNTLLGTNFWWCHVNVN